MQLSHRSLALIPFLSTLAAAADLELAHRPEPGSGWSTTFVIQSSLDGGELEVRMNGEEIPSAYLPELHLSAEEERVLSVHDTLSEEQPGTWLRRYEEASWTNEGSMESGGPASDWASDAETEIEGCSFRIRSEEDGYDWEAQEDRGRAFDGLQADLSLSALLPGKSVALGESWSVDGAELGLLFEPGGDLGWSLPEESVKYLLPEILERDCEGSLELTLLEEEDSLARCSVRGELVRTTVSPGDLSEVPIVDGEATDTTIETWELEGELVWDLAAGILSRLELGGELTSSTRTLRDDDGEGPEYEHTFSVRGTHRVEVHVTPGPAPQR